MTRTHDFARYIGTFMVLLISSPIFAQDVSPPSGDPAYISPDARLQTLFNDGLALTESPAEGPDGIIYFSDLTFTSAATEAGWEAGHIWRYNPKTGETAMFRSPSGMSNGLKFDAQDRLIVAEGADYGGRRVTRTDMKTGKSYIIAGQYEGQPFNSPNDLAIDEQGRVYFSDPRYVGHESLDQPIMAVYRIDPDGTIHRIITDASKPNGVVISPDQNTLYVVSNDNGSFDVGRITADIPTRKGQMALLAYDLHPDGSATFRKLLVDYLPEDGPDGLTVDVEGNLYIAERSLKRPGIAIRSPEGKELAFIPTVLPTNVGFGRGENSNTLYITAGIGLYRINVMKQGYHLPR